MKVLILGSGVSGQSAKEFLEKNGYETEFASPEDINSGENLKDENYLSRLFEGLLFIVKSPGIKSDCPLLELAKKRKIKVVSEFELGASRILGDIIAVTGTNGKTTTVSIIYHLLAGQHKKTFLAGNIGTAVTKICDKTTTGSISVLECSSFQLDKINHFAPHIAAILNLSEDHLSFHKSMKNYIKAKQNITKNQTNSDFLLLNFDDELLMKNLPETRAQIYFFSTKCKVKGCFVKDQSIYFSDGKTENKLVSLKNVKLVGEHNISNILCATLAVWLQTKQLFLLGGINSFHAAENRLEFVKNVGGVAYYNDSKATNISSTLVAVKSFKQNINLILGGSDKGYDFDELFKDLPKNVTNIVAMGATAEKIMKSGERTGFLNICQTKTMKEAIILCKNQAKEGEIVLLSPACASFDQFRNFEERGNVFKKIVEEFDFDETKTANQKQNK